MPCTRSGISRFGCATFRPSALRWRPCPCRFGNWTSKPGEWAHRRRRSSRQNSVAIRYSIEWDDPGPFSSQLNAHHAFINLAEILMYVPDRRAEDTQVAFEQRAGRVETLPPSCRRRPQPIRLSPRATTRWWTRPWRQGSSKNSVSIVAVRISASSLTQPIGIAGTWRMAAADNSVRVEADGRPSIPGIHILFHIGSRIFRRWRRAWSTPIPPRSRTLAREAAVSIAAHEFFHAGM